MAFSRTRFKQQFHRFRLLGWGEIPTMRGLQRLVGKISAGAGGEKFSGGDVAGGVDMELDGNVNGAADGGARFR